MPDAIERQEQALRREMRDLLMEARLDVRRRIAEREPATDGGTIYRQMEGAITEAIGQVNGRMEQSMRASDRIVIDLGAESAVSTLPKGEKLIHFALSQTLVSTVAAYHAELIRDVTGDLARALTRQVQLGVLAGKPMHEIAQDITAARATKGEGLLPLGPFKTAARRAEVIAVTETNRVANVAIHARYEDAAQRIPGLQKRWLTADDGRVRPSHFFLDGITIPVDALFDAGGEKAKHPLDPALSAKQSTNCRCRLVCVVPEEAVADEWRRVVERFGVGEQDA